MNIKKSISKVSLVISNLIPLYGVVFWGWNSSSIIFIYWMESIIIGVVNILKIFKARGKFRTEDLRSIVQINTMESLRDKNKFELVISFIFHYLIFIVLYGVFLEKFFAAQGVEISFMLISSLSIYLSHLISYKTNYINKGEYLRVSPVKMFNQPFKRIVVLHLAILFGGILSAESGDPIYALIIIIILKTVLDLYLHNKEHKTLGGEKDL